jgi:hypothetical protein
MAASPSIFDLPPMANSSLLARVRPVGDVVMISSVE